MNTAEDNVDEWKAMAASLAAAIDVEPSEENVERPQKLVKKSTLKWTDRRLHVFYCVVLRQVFEWCALSDFFLDDDLFFDYRGKKIFDVHNRPFTKPSKPFFMTIAVCKAWLREVQLRVRACPLRMNYDMRVLKCSGIMQEARVGLTIQGDSLVCPRLCRWGKQMLALYETKGGESAIQATHRGVELCFTREHAFLYEKMLNFCQSKALGKITGLDSMAEQPFVQFRKLQVIGNGVLDYYDMKRMQDFVRVRECEDGIVFYAPQAHMKSWSGLESRQVTCSLSNRIVELTNMDENKSTHAFYMANNKLDFLVGGYTSTLPF